LRDEFTFGDNLARTWRAGVNAVARKRCLGRVGLSDAGCASLGNNGAPNARQVIPNDQTGRKCLIFLKIGSPDIEN
jgi:hypothetical protein